MADHHLAQLNIATMRAPLDDPVMADFVALLDPVNALADASPGFVWRLKDEGTGDASGLRPFGPDVLVNLSVWQSLQALWDFTYGSAHLDVLRRRREWFSPMPDSHMALWWVPAGHLPDLEEARERLELLRTRGPSPRAFDFRDRYAPPGQEAEGPG